MNLMLNKYFLNYKTYFICNIKGAESCQKHRFNKTETATSRNTVKQNENLVVDR